GLCATVEREGECAAPDWPAALRPRCACLREHLPVHRRLLAPARTTGSGREQEAPARYVNRPADCLPHTPPLPSADIASRRALVSGRTASLSSLRPPCKEPDPPHEECQEHCAGLSGAPRERKERAQREP